MISILLLADPTQSPHARSGPEHGGHWRQVRGKYPQYGGQILDGPVIVVTIESWTGWAMPRNSGR